VRNVAARCFGPFAALQAADDLPALFNQLLVTQPGDWKSSQCGVLAAASILEKVPKCLVTNGDAIKAAAAKASAADSQIPVKQAATKLIANIIFSSADDALTTSMVIRLSEMLGDVSADVKVAVLNTIKEIAKKSHASIVKQLPRLVPAILLLAKERKLVRVKFAGERALLHLLQFSKSDSILKKYCKVIDESAAKDLTDYCTRVLGSLGDSDDEESILQ